MIINQSVGFTFIHIPKAAGTSVTQFLSPLNGPLDLEIGGTVFGEEIQPAYARRYKLRKHSTLAEAQATISMARPPKDMFVFTFVRNPYARLSSIFSFLRQWEGYNPDLLRIMKSFSDFQEFVESGIFTHLPGPDNIFRPQTDWLKIDGQIAESVKLFHIEEGASAINAIRQELTERGADPSLLPDSFPHSNRSESQPLEGFGLSKRLVSSIDTFYATDFSALGYSHSLSE
ncbi:sulfotransferase family protein [Roseovarius mucosus]|uniref:sulfotransferase family 2 domain-containing protein n=1 Tax=Roseovarius mucosus TaxID=215743 RepID=UPI001C5E87D3|nr:sulfotransferase family 2 domain-containing protein [Roseovarius mucosus]MBW4975846.1 sulfotransferase family protein [Roseovarius mucosus]